VPNCSAKQAGRETLTAKSTNSYIRRDLVRFEPEDERPKPTAFWAFRFVLFAAPYYPICGSPVFASITFS
jgi:hypothetical protein